MRTSDPPVASFGRLAEAALSHAEWPSDTQPKHRSLATLFSKFDREQDLEWLVDRPEVQRILAELMRRPLGDVQQALPSRQPIAAGRLVPLHDIRFGRELDLSRERLCPGIPEQLYEPAGWGALWWHAPSGSGRSLLGAWLVARGLAHHVSVESARELEGLPARGPLFVEVTAEAPELDPARLHDLLGAARRPVCIAAARELPSGTRDWQPLASTPLERVLPELVNWVRARLGEEGHFEPERALVWMERVALPSGAVRTLGDALGLLGMLDEIKPRTLTGRSLDEIAESFVRTRIEETSRESTVSTWLNKNAFPALLGTIAQLITESDRSLSAPRTFDEWIALVPDELRRGVDVEWMQSALVTGAPSQSATTWRWKGDDVARAARKLPPGGYQLVRSFEHARLLVKDGERLRLAPHWLGTLLQARATSSLLSTSPFVWGEALLRPAHAAATLHALWSRATTGKLEPLYAVLDLEAPENPAHVAATEAAATVTGLALLAGANMPSDLVSDLFDEQQRSCVVLAGTAPAPRLPHPGAATEPLLHSGTWLVSLLALSERAEGARRMRAFDPWRSSDTQATRTLLRDSVYPLIDESLRCGGVTTPAWALSTFSLIDRLRRQVGSAAEMPSPLELPSAVCDALERGGADAALLERLGRHSLGLPATVEVARGRGTPPSTLWRALWASLARLPEVPAGFEPELVDASPTLRELWREVPVEVVKRRLQARAALPWSILLPHHYAAALSSNVPLPRAACESGPRPILLEALQTRGLFTIDPDGLSVLWRTAARELLAFLARRLDSRQLEELGLLLSSSLPALSAADSELLPQIVQLLRARTDVTNFPRTLLEDLRGWLASCVAERVPGWREAYPLFHLVQTSLTPLHLSV